MYDRTHAHRTLAAAPSRPACLARAVVAALFLTNGAVFFNVVPRYPEILAASW